LTSNAFASKAPVPSSKIYTLPKGGNDFITTAPADDYLAYDYENEEPTDEARTNEEGYEELL